MSVGGGGSFRRGERDSHTGMNFNIYKACFAFDRAAPVEFAHAALLSPFAMTFISAIAAQEVAAVDGFRRLSRFMTTKQFDQLV